MYADLIARISDGVDDTEFEAFSVLCEELFLWEERQWESVSGGFLISQNRKHEKIQQLINTVKKKGTREDESSRITFSKKIKVSYESLSGNKLEKAKPVELERFAQFCLLLGQNWDSFLEQKDLIEGVYHQRTGNWRKFEDIHLSEVKEFSALCEEFFSSEAPPEVSKHSKFFIPSMDKPAKSVPRSRLPCISK